MQSAQDRLASLEDGLGDAARQKKEAERASADLRKKVQDVEMQLRKVEAEKTSKEHAIRSLQVSLCVFHCKEPRVS